MNNNELAAQARGVAHCLSYNGNQHEAAAKHLLREMSHRLDAMDVKAIRRIDGLWFRNGSFLERRATLKESLLYRLFGVLPRKL